MSKPKRASQHADESPMDYLRRLVSACNHEREALLDHFKTVEAVMDYFDLWHTYDTEFWDGILECIADGDSPKAARAFVAKHKLGKDWIADINIRST